MHKKLLAVCGPICAIAALMMVATAASASPLLTQPTGTAAPVGTTFKTTTIGVSRMTTSIGNFECSTALNTGTLTKNNGTEIEGNIESFTVSGTGAEGACTSPLGNFKITTNLGNGTPYCMSAKSSYAADELRIRGGKCSEATRPITYLIDLLSFGVTCDYQRSAAITATYTTEPSDATATENDVPFTLVSGGSVCPAEAKLDAALTLERNKTTSEPAYIS